VCAQHGHLYLTKVRN